VVKVLNRAIQADPEAVLALINNRVECNEALAVDPTIQIKNYPDPNKFEVGLLGVINGVIGIRDSDGWGYITLVEDDDKTIPPKFELTTRGGTVG